MSEELRHQCRRCRIKLSAPVSNPLDAFCCRGCFRYYFQSKCLICERQKSGGGLACNHPKCRTELAAKRRYSTRGKYVETGIVAPSSAPHRDGSANPTKQALCEADKGVGTWRQIAGPVITMAELRLATVPDGQNMTWIGGNYRRAENASHAALVKAGLAFDRQADQAEIEANGYFEDRPWREVISADGVRCYR
jgi:hypothetical protein